LNLAPGSRLGPYEVIGAIGAGGMGEVWKALDTRVDRLVAIKCLKADHAERFMREARAIAALNHPRICQLYDLGPGYLVMEYVEGKPLKGPLPVDDATKLATQIAEALTAAHEKGIVHRDLKPANILVNESGAKLLDFGLAKRDSLLLAGDATISGAMTEHGVIAGTIAYMSPEQALGRPVDARSDVFSFGAGSLRVTERPEGVWRRHRAADTHGHHPRSVAGARRPPPGSDRETVSSQAAWRSLPVDGRRRGGSATERQ
jgi:serine/threonine protein kinase